MGTMLARVSSRTYIDWPYRSDEILKIYTKRDGVLSSAAASYEAQRV